MLTTSGAGFLVQWCRHHGNGGGGTCPVFYKWLGTGDTM